MAGTVELGDIFWLAVCLLLFSTWSVHTFCGYISLLISWLSPSLNLSGFLCWHPESLITLFFLIPFPLLILLSISLRFHSHLSSLSLSISLSLSLSVCLCCVYLACLVYPRLKQICWAVTLLPELKHYSFGSFVFSAELPWQVSFIIWKDNSI